MHEDWRQLLDTCPPQNIHLYFVGVAGISMFGLAEMCHRWGYRVSGSDRAPNHRTERLEVLGITVFPEQKEEQIDTLRPDLVIRTAAVPPTHPEIVAAQALQIPVVDRGCFLGWVASRYPELYAVAGTHGKTTTTSLLSTLLHQGDLPPSVHVGAELEAFGGSTVSCHPDSKAFVVEACEYANSYHHLNPTTACILNIDLDHVDFFGTLDAILESFVQFACNLRPGGCLVLPQEGPNVERFRTLFQKACVDQSLPLPRIRTFGLECSGADLEIRNLRFEEGLPQFSVFRNQTFWFQTKLQIPGLHNVLNVAAALAMCSETQISPELLSKALQEFGGAEGRFSRKGFFQGALCVADYAHHPTATRVTLEAARALPHRKIWVVYQPLTFHRVQALFEEYLDALDGCEEILFYEIFSDREQTDHGMSAKLLADAMQKRGTVSGFYTSYEEIRNRLQQLCAENDLVLFLGPEEVRSFADRLVREE